MLKLKKPALPQRADLVARLRRRLSRRTARRAADPSAEVAELLDLARRSFVSVQQAWDRADLSALAHVATEPLFEELRLQLAERGPQPNHTEVLEVEARLLSVDDMPGAQVASVEFSGLIREDRHAGPMPFRELWMLARVNDAGPRWRVARVQALA